MRFLAVTALAAALLAAQASAADTAGFAFLQVPVGARAVALGGAFSSVTGDPLALYWNPASALTVPSQMLTTNYTGYLMDMQAGFAGWLSPHESDAVGVSLNYFYGGSFDRTTMSDPLGDGTTFSSNSVALSGTYARRVTDEIGAGVSGKFVYSTIDTYNGNAFLADVGLTWSPGAVDFLDAALVVRNAGIQTKAFYAENDPLPTEVTAGASAVLMDDRLLVTTDLTYPINGDFWAGLGAEYSPMEMLTLRAGGNTRDMDAADQAGGGFVDGLAFGVGTRWNRFGLDYSFKPFADLGSIHRISLAFSL
jgi:hypothetical protein